MPTCQRHVNTEHPPSDTPASTPTHHHTTPPDQKTPSSQPPGNSRHPTRPRVQLRRASSSLTLINHSHTKASRRPAATPLRRTVLRREDAETVKLAGDERTIRRTGCGGHVFMQCALRGRCMCFGAMSCCTFYFWNASSFCGIPFE